LTLPLAEVGGTEEVRDIDGGNTDDTEEEEEREGEAMKGASLSSSPSFTGIKLDPVRTCLRFREEGLFPFPMRYLLPEFD